MKPPHWFLCIANGKNCDWSRKNQTTVKPDSCVIPRGMKTHSESRIEPRNPQILKKIREKSNKFLSSEQPCEQKNVDVVSNIAGVEKYP